MKTLRLTLKAEWYNMIERGEKTEEYREIKEFWDVRIWRCRESIDKVTFSFGYTNTLMTFEVDSIAIGRGREEWGAPSNRDVYIIKLGIRVL